MWINYPFNINPISKENIMQKYAIKSGANGSIDIVEFDESQSYETIKEAIGGGTFDCIRIPSLNADMWIDDDGKLVEEPEYNILASALWTIEHGMTDMVAGDVLITGGVDDEGKTLGLTKDGALQVLKSAKEMTEQILQLLYEIK
jgi:hypothetical protein